MSWEAVAGVEHAITGLVIAVTAFVGFDQLRQLREQRRDSATVELVRTFQDIGPEPGQTQDSTTIRRDAPDQDNVGSGQLYARSPPT